LVYPFIGAILRLDLKHLVRKTHEPVRTVAADY
jgi:hypothetical protein